MGRPKIEESLSNSQPNRPIGGAIATTDAKRLITPKPLVVDSNVLYPCNPWVNQNKMAISDFICAWIVFPPSWNLFKTYFCELVLGFSPDQNQTTAEMFSGKWLSIIIEKKLKFQLTFAKGRKKVWKRRGQFHLNSYNSWTEWDIFTKLRTHVYDIVFWSNKKNWPDSPLGGAIRLGKL